MIFRLEKEQEECKEKYEKKIVKRPITLKF
jgi:hypothetical protein